MSLNLTTLKKLCAFFLFWGMVISASAGTQLVSSNLDNGLGSLREAVGLAQAGDTIRFDSALLNTGTDTLFLDSQIVIDKSLVIKGLIIGTDSLWISGKNLSRIFIIDISSNQGTVIIDSINFCFGNAQFYQPAERHGGAIKVDKAQRLEVWRSTFKMNHAGGLGGAIYADSLSTLDIGTSHFKQNSALSGGAILTRGKPILMVENCQFIQNNTTSITGSGGAIGTDFSAFINQSIFFQNTANRNGGALHYHSTKYLNPLTTINGCQFIQNTAGNSGGACYLESRFNADSLLLNINQSIFHKNTSGVEGGAITAILNESTQPGKKLISISIDSSDFIQNNAAKGGALYSFSDSLKNTILEFSLTNSLIDSCRSTSFSTGALDIKLPEGNSLNPNLNRLYLNFYNTEILNCYSGNPNQLTHGLLAWASHQEANIVQSSLSKNDNASYLIGNMILKLNIDSCQINDNRGFGFELNSKKTRNVTLHSSRFSGNQNSAFICLGDFFGSPDVIDSCRIDSCQFSYNQATEGAAFQFLKPNRIHLEAKNSIFSHNNVSQDGGAFYIEGTENATINIDQISSFSGNSAGWDGGAIFIYSDTLKASFSNTILDSNTAVQNGGAIFLKTQNDTATLSMANTMGSYNVANGDGGGVFIEGPVSKVKLRRNFWSTNNAQNGGFIALKNNNPNKISLIVLSDSTLIHNNVSTNNGGAIHTSFDVKVEAYSGTKFEGNSTQFSGGTIYSNYVKLIDSEIKNSSAIRGGAIHTITNGILISERSSFSFCTASIDGGVAQSDSVAFIDSWAHQNTCTRYGGAIYTNKVFSKGSTFNHNYAQGRGGALSLHHIANVTIETSTFYKNRADEYGGAICIRDQGTSTPIFNPEVTSTIKNSTFYENTSPNFGSTFHFYSSKPNGNVVLDFEGSILASSNVKSIYSSPQYLNSNGFNVISSSFPSPNSLDQLTVPGNLNMDTLKNNGGFAPTCLPGEFTLPINMGNPQDSSEAQNGFIFLNRDIGAAETNYCSVVTNQYIEGCDSLLLPNGTIVKNSGYYLDTLTNVNGCDSAVSIIASISKSKVTVDTVVSCYTGYLWYLNNVDYFQSGIYKDTVTIPNTGCPHYGSLHLTIPDIDTAVTLIPFQTDSVQLVAQDTSADSYQWYDCSAGLVPITGEAKRIFSPLQNGNYLVEIEKSGCVKRSSCFTITGVSVTEIGNQKVQLFPNPVRAQLNFSGLATTNNQTIIVRNLLGEEVLSHQIMSGSSIDLSGIAAGIYTLEIISEGVLRFREKIVKQ